MNRYDLSQPQAYTFRFTFSVTPQAEALCRQAVIAANLPAFTNMPSDFERSEGREASDDLDNLVLWYNRATGRALWFNEKSEGAVRHWWVNVNGLAKPVYETLREWRTLPTFSTGVEIPNWPAIEVLLPSQFGGLLAARVDPSFAMEVNKDLTIPNRICLERLVHTNVIYGTTREALVVQKELRSWLETKALDRCLQLS